MSRYSTRSTFLVLVHPGEITKSQVESSCSRTAVIARQEQTATSAAVMRDTQLNVHRRHEVHSGAALENPNPFGFSAKVRYLTRRGSSSPLRGIK